MQIKTSITEVDFIKVNYQLLWMKPITKLLAVFCLFLLSYHFYYQTFDPYYKGTNLVLYFVLIVCWIGIIWWVARRNYRTNKRIQEDLLYNIDSDKLAISGESFKVELSWNKVHRIIKTKKWILIFQSRQSANLIELNSCNEEVIKALKEICSANNIKNNL